MDPPCTISLRRFSRSKPNQQGHENSQYRAEIHRANLATSAKYLAMVNYPLKSLIGDGRRALTGQSLHIVSGPRDGRRAEAAAKDAQTHAKAADVLSPNVLPIIRQILATGATTTRAIAEPLNARGVHTARGGTWYASTVANVLKRGGQQ